MCIRDRFGSGPFGLASKNAPGISSYDLIFGEGTAKTIKDAGRELDKEYKLTDKNYTIDDFIEDLLKKSYIKKEIDPNSYNNLNKIVITSKTEKLLREHALKQVFGNLKKTKTGNHKSKFSGYSDDTSGDFRRYQFGDSIDKISITESIKNAQLNSFDELRISESDLVVYDSLHKNQMSTILMIDISHSMILYGEDRITPAKKVAMALAELITTRYPKDTLDIIVFGNEAKVVELKDLPYLKVGPYHTNTVAGIQLAMDILKRKKNNNKQILMITDGKPSCLKLRDGSFYKNSAGLDPKIINKCYNMEIQARKLMIQITTFMIARDC